MISLLLRSFFAEDPPLAHPDESRVKGKERSDEASLLGPKASLRRGEPDERGEDLPRRDPILLILMPFLMSSMRTTESRIAENRPRNRKRQRNPDLKRTQGLFFLSILERTLAFDFSPFTVDASVTDFRSPWADSVDHVPRLDSRNSIPSFYLNHPATPADGGGADLKPVSKAKLSKLVGVPSKLAS